jgi:hypothetical protein
MNEIFQSDDKVELKVHFATTGRVPGKEMMSLTFPSDLVTLNSFRLTVSNAYSKNT